jgi:hypothetical protein
MLITLKERLESVISNSQPLNEEFDDEVDDLLLTCISSSISTEDLHMTCEPSDSESLSCTTDIDSCLHMTCSSGSIEPQYCISFYIAGYVAHKMHKFTSCPLCLNQLVNSNDVDYSEAKELVKLRNFSGGTCGGLSHPSQSLFSLLSLLESCVNKHSAILSTYLYQDIVNDVIGDSSLPACAIGCAEHTVSITARCIHFYVATCMHIRNRQRNKCRASRLEKQKLTKVSKLM